VADALPIPDDLAELQRALVAAQAATEEYGRAVDAERRALYQEPDQWRERIWPEGGPERAELARLRAERDALVVQIRKHPVMEQARAEGCLKETQWALQKAGRLDPQEDSA
jgi:hypothetical protein